MDKSPANVMGGMVINIECLRQVHIRPRERLFRAYKETIRIYYGKPKQLWLGATMSDICGLISQYRKAGEGCI